MLGSTVEKTAFFVTVPAKIFEMTGFRLKDLTERAAVPHVPICNMTRLSGPERLVESHHTLVPTRLFCSSLQQQRRL